MQREIIFNPQHILTALKANDAACNTRPNIHNYKDYYKRRNVIFSQLCGFAQRLASEPVKQDIRQGACYLIEENERRTRQSRFNTLDNNYDVVKNSLVDVSVSSVIDGLGYKFGESTCHTCSKDYPWRVFSKLMSNKNNKLSVLYHLTSAINSQQLQNSVK